MPCITACDWYCQCTNAAGSGEFLLQQKGSEKVVLVVRTINSSAFAQQDWDEYVTSVSMWKIIGCSRSWYVVNWAF